MMPAADPRQDLRRQVWASAVVAAGLVAVAATWAALRPALAAPPTAGGVTGAEAARPTVAALSATAWNVVLWQPLSDAPAPAAPAAPLALKLFSILTQDGGLIAALDPGDGGALIYARAGDTVKGATITAVDATGVSVSSGGATQRLELAP